MSTADIDVTVLTRNPSVNPRKVEELLQFLRDLEAAGVDTKSRYGLTHPFATEPSKVRQQPRAWTQNRAQRRP
jgi:hypothetical protein